MSCSDDDADVADIYNKESECNDSYLDHQMDDLQESKQYCRGRKSTRAAEKARNGDGNYGQILRLEEVESADDEAAPHSKHDGVEDGN